MVNVRYTKAAIAVDGDGTWLRLLIHPQDGYKARRMVLEQKDRLYTAELKQYREKRSLDANSYFHVLVGKISEATNVAFEEVKTWLVTEYGTVERDENGLKVGFKLPATVDVSKIYRYVKCFDTRKEGGVEFNCYIVFKQTHLMDTQEMSRLIDGAVTEAKILGIETLPPDKLAAMVEGWQSA